MCLWKKILMMLIIILTHIFLCGGNVDMNDLYKDPMFNPIMQYEQAFSYYKYLCMQMDHQIKCKEYEKLCQTNTKTSSLRE